MIRNPWKVGDYVRFAHEPEGTRRKITAVIDHPRDPMVEVEGLVGQFGAHIFVDSNYRADSIVPRPKK